MSFVRLENLNDFIQPGSTCVKPNDKKAGVVAKVSDINLSDCLACSGCITTAETVLVQQQNHEELFKVINESKSLQTKRDVVVSMSLQSISSLAYKYSMSAQETAERLASFFMSIGCDEVHDINLARHLALVESYKEFKNHKNLKQNLPIISSVCPGWVCYTEKTNGDLVIPHLSKVKSPQQIMGALLKKYYQNRLGKSRAQVYHVTLMPCFDKKLEASRQDFKDPLDETQDVDCVLTPIELQEILKDEGVTLQDFEPRKLNVLFETLPEFTPLTNHLGSVSGGYAENLFLTELNEKSCKYVNDQSLEYNTLKNRDFIELSVRHNVDLGGDVKSEVLSKYAIINGFRNIQTVVQRLKRKALKYDYIEVMACPSGCINGGAQCRPNDGHDQSAAVSLSRDIYKKVPIVSQVLQEAEIIIQKLIKELNLADERECQQMLFTQFHAVPKMQNLTVSW